MSPDELRQMPSSLNDACRKMDMAADEIERLRAENAVMRATLDGIRTAVNAWRESDIHT